MPKEPSQVSVPLRGMWFEIAKLSPEYGFIRNGFRPLTGNVV